MYGCFYSRKKAVTGVIITAFHWLEGTHLSKQYINETKIYQLKEIIQTAIHTSSGRYQLCSCEYIQRKETFSLLPRFFGFEPNHPHPSHTLPHSLETKVCTAPLLSSQNSTPPCWNLPKTFLEVLWIFPVMHWSIQSFSIPPSNPWAFACRPCSGIKDFEAKGLHEVENLNQKCQVFPAEYTWLIKVVLVWRSSNARGLSGVGEGVSKLQIDWHITPH